MAFYELALLENGFHQRKYDPSKHIDFCRVRNPKKVMGTDYDGVIVVGKDGGNLIVRYSGFSRTSKVPIGQCFDFLYKGTYEDSELSLTREDVIKAIKKTEEVYKKEGRQYPVEG